MLVQLRMRPIELFTPSISLESTEPTKQALLDTFSLTTECNTMPTMETPCVFSQPQILAAASLNLLFQTILENAQTLQMEP